MRAALLMAFFPPCGDRSLCCVLIPWVSHYQGTVIKSGFRVTLIDKNRPGRRGAAGSCFDMQQMCEHNLHVNELWDDSGGGGAPHSVWFLWVSVKHLGSVLFVLGVWHQNKNPQIPVAFILERCFFPHGFSVQTKVTALTATDSVLTLLHNQNTIG